MDNIEQGLLERVAQNDIAAFREIYDLYWHKLFLTAYKKTQKQDIAEEIVQDIFSKLWERRHRLEIDNLEPYLFTALKYAVISHIRVEIKKKNSENLDAYADTLITTLDENPQNTWDLQTALDQALRFLPDKTRLIFEMSRYEEMPHREIAQQLDISEKAVEYHITQALKLLRVQLKDFMPLWLLFIPSIFPKIFF